MERLSSTMINSCDQQLIEAQSLSPSHKSQNSPRKSSTHQPNRHKEKRQASVTPRKFTRFFNPRSNGPHPYVPSRRALEDITAPTNNRRGIQSSPLRPPRAFMDQESSPAAFTCDMKRRKLLHTPSPPPEDSSRDNTTSLSQLRTFDDDDSEEHSHNKSSPCSKSVKGRTRENHNQSLGSQNIPNKSIRQIDNRGLAGQMLQLSLGSRPVTNRYIYLSPVSDWQDQTADFYSGPEDTHLCTSVESSSRSIPFCVESCNTNSLVAVGDEEGNVRLLESGRNGKPQFKDVFLAFRPHSNAIIDLNFSLDDSLLATASGDQTARVVDMTTQRTISVLAQHSASLKQVRFQPGVANNSVIATSSRDGSVQIWDLRCKGIGGPVQDIHIPMDTSNVVGTSSRTSDITYGCVIDSIYDAHRPGLRGRLSQSALTRDGPSRGEVPGRVGDVSVTAITFLPEGQEHMLLTASEANASVKLWDVRSLRNTRRKTALPLSCTTQPESHSQWRHFGINALNLSGDGSRLYTLCKDNTVYVYSTAHLILGQAPELSMTAKWRRRKLEDVRESIGPLYGFRHPQLHATSFYVKSAIRPAKAGKSEMLAVGSCDACTILFPTDERYLDFQQKSTAAQPNKQPCLGLAEIQVTGLPRFSDGIPMSNNGTALIRGHDREIGALTWTSDGELVTVGDDFLVRCWREGSSARRLRTYGERGGQRWGCGWADVLDSYDNDDE